MITVNRKIQAAVVGGALATIIVWIVSALWIDVPAEVAAAVATLFSGVLGWAVPEPDKEKADAVRVS